MGDQEPEDGAVPADLENGDEGAPKKRKLEKPKKADYRQRAHCNPLSDSYIEYPIAPGHVDWSQHYPEIFGVVSEEPLRPWNTSELMVKYPSEPVDPSKNAKDGKKVTMVDVGCGFGGLLVALGPLYPDKLILGMEIREQVTTYVGERILALRAEHEGKSYTNCSVLRTNVMKFLVNYFQKGQLEKMFFCFPDPHFKRKNWRRRIISEGLLSLYAYALCEGGLLYAITDVKDLFDWMYTSCKGHLLFEEVPVDEMKDDPAFKAIHNATEEGMKVLREQRPMWSCVFRRLPDPPLPL